MRRRKPPNEGLWSPCGGKLDTATGESPHGCAARETREELALPLAPADFHLAGLISEHGYAGEANWLLFLFECLPRLTELPASIDEGDFGFFSRNQIQNLAIPVTDREQIWPLFWKYRAGFFAAHCQCTPNGNRWALEQAAAP